MGRELSPKFEFDEKSLCERVTEKGLFVYVHGISINRCVYNESILTIL